MDFLITPYKSVGSIEFGMAQSDVQELFVSEPRTITHQGEHIRDIYKGIEEGIQMLVSLVFRHWIPTTSRIRVV